MASYEDILNNYFGGSAQAYAAEISRKDSAGQAMSSPAAAAAFQAANPQYFGGGQQQSEAPMYTPPPMASSSTYTTDGGATMSTPETYYYNQPPAAAPAVGHTPPINLAGYQPPQGQPSYTAINGTQRLINGQWYVVPTNVRADWRPTEAFYPELDPHSYYTSNKMAGYTSEGNPYYYSYSPQYIYTDPKTGQQSYIPAQWKDAQQLAAAGGLGQYDEANYQWANRDVRSYNSWADYEDMLNDPAMRNPDTGYTYGSLMDKGEFFERFPNASPLDYADYLGHVYQGQAPQARAASLESWYAQNYYDQWAANRQWNLERYGVEPSPLYGGNYEAQLAASQGDYERAYAILASSGTPGEAVVGSTAPRAAETNPRAVMGSVAASPTSLSAGLAPATIDYLNKHHGGADRYILSQNERYQAAVMNNDAEMMLRLQNDAQRVGYQLQPVNQQFQPQQQQPSGPMEMYRNLMAEFGSGPEAPQIDMQELTRQALASMSDYEKGEMDRIMKTINADAERRGIYASGIPSEMQTLAASELRSLLQDKAFEQAKTAAGMMMEQYNTAWRSFSENRSFAMEMLSTQMATALREAELTGYYQGSPTMAMRSMMANQSLANQELALKQQDMELSQQKQDWQMAMYDREAPLNDALIRAQIANLGRSGTGGSSGSSGASTTDPSTVRGEVYEIQQYYLGEAFDLAEAALLPGARKQQVKDAITALQTAAHKFNQYKSNFNPTAVTTTNQRTAALLGQLNRKTKTMGQTKTHNIMNYDANDWVQYR